jgi:Peptidase family M48
MPTMRRMIFSFGSAILTVGLAVSQTAPPVQKPSPATPASAVSTQSTAPASAVQVPQSTAPAPAPPPDASTPSASTPNPTTNAAPSSAVPSATPVPASSDSVAPAAAHAGPPPSFDQVLDLIVDRENRFVEQMQKLHPLVETYIQNMKDDPDLNTVPVSDEYFFGRLVLDEGQARDVVFTTRSNMWHRSVEKLTDIYAMKFQPLGFAQMVMLDTTFDRRNYDFKFVRREFLGEVRCIAIDVQPKDKEDQKFVGRIWVEDQDYHIVRFNGSFGTAARGNVNLHFDSWRLNIRPGLWLPTFIYSEESNLKYGLGQKLKFKSQTRLWGYDTSGLDSNSEFSEIMVESTDQDVKDKSETRQDASPTESQREWERQAERNVVDRLQKIGLLAPPGEVEKVLQTVVNNLEVTNNIDLQPEVSCRILLTTPLESFTIGRTIVISRGLIDVLPDEASLAMVLSHELSHVVLGHKLDTKMAFNDRMFFPDEKTFQTMEFSRNPRDEEAADKKAIELLNNSPYKDKLAVPGLFLRAVQLRAPNLKQLIRSHLGNGLHEGGFRMDALTQSAPALDFKKLDQIAALPLGGRVKVDAWTNKVALLKSKPVALVSASEKMPFEVTPFFPYLTRLTPDSAPEKSPAAAPGN